MLARAETSWWFLTALLAFLTNIVAGLVACKTFQTVYTFFVTSATFRQTFLLWNANAIAIASPALFADASLVSYDNSGAELSFLSLLFQIVCASIRACSESCETTHFIFRAALWAIVYWWWSMFWWSEMADLAGNALAIAKWTAHKSWFANAEWFLNGSLNLGTVFM